MKRKLISIILVLCLTLTSFGTTTRIVSDKLGAFTGPASGTEQDDNVKASLDLVHNKIGPVLTKGTGTIYYVDSGATAGGETGLDWTNAKLTIKEGADLATADRGDHVMVAAGHAESLTGADGVDLDLAGVTVWGLGEGDGRPGITFSHANAEFVVGAANVTVYNLRFIAGITSITMGISVEDAGDNFTLANCIFPKPTTNSWEFLDAIDVASGVTDIRIINCEYYNDEGGAAPNHFIDLGNAVLDGVYIADNIIRGDFAVSAIWSNDADDEVYILRNTISNMTSGQHCIEFTADALGVCAHNDLYADTYSATLDPGAMDCFENYASDSANKTARLVPAARETIGTGNVFYVDSGVTSGGDGLTWATATSTIENAIVYCTTSNGDFIHVAQGHSETLGGADAVDFDKIGITCIGFGEGNLRPTLNYDTNTDEVVIGADDITIKNIRFIPSVTAITLGIDIEAGADNAKIIDCEFGPPDIRTVDEFAIGINIGVVTGTLIENCKMDSDEAQAAVGIKLVGQTNATTIRGCTIIGDYSTANINGITTLSQDLLIEDNILWNGVVSGLNTEPVWELLTGTVGISRRNFAVCNESDMAAAFVGDGMYNFENHYSEAPTGAITGMNIDLVAATSADLSIHASGI